ncbi:MAG: oligosaccharide repeat unit polymerase [Candidatus Marinimicrobia bacterium]|nr:oligosaccharide repeat unit polymerase [FCB group bacterium]MBL7024724.1 oligosaccharide repeat unit polymerase [Candidatus Neomarinimicrobiota bacterium]
MKNNNSGTIHANDWNIDLKLVFMLPLVLVAVLIWMPNEWLLESSLLCISIFAYILITYKYRLIYGFSGIRIISIPSAVIATYTVFIAIPSIYILMIRDHQNESAYFYSILLFYYLFPAGLFLGQLYRKIDVPRAWSILGSKVETDKGDNIFYEMGLILFSICVLILGLYLLRVDQIPLIEVLKNPGGNAKFALMREDALKTLHMTIVEKYLFHWLRSLFIPFGIVSTLFLTNFYKLKKYKLLFVSFFILGLFVNSLTLEKSPLAAIFLSIAAYIFLKRTKIKPYFILMLLVIILSGPVLISYFLFADRPDVYKVLLWSYINRILVTPAEVLFYYFQFFPERHEFLLGRSTQLFSWMTAEGLFNVSNYVAKLWWKMPTTTGSANAHYLGLYWASFGWWGTTLATLFFGFITHIFHWKILDVAKYRKNIIYITSIAVAIPNFTFGFFSSNFTILFFTKGLVVLIGFLMVFEYLKTSNNTKASVLLRNLFIPWLRSKKLTNGAE